MAALTDYAGVVGQLLAKGHARTSGASMIAGYMGSSDRVDKALCKFARRYADQTEADHAALVEPSTADCFPLSAGYRSPDQRHSSCHRSCRRRLSSHRCGSASNAARSQLARSAAAR